MKKDILKSSIRNTIDGILIFLLFITTTVYALPSNGVIYDNSSSGSSATNVHDAIDDLYTKVNDKQNEIDRINGIGDAGSNHILSGKTAYVKGATVTGTIPSKGAATYTPGTKNQTISSGNYLSGVQTIKGDANLVAGNIKAGSSIFGVSGDVINKGKLILPITYEDINWNETASMQLIITFDNGEFNVAYDGDAWKYGVNLPYLEPGSSDHFIVFHFAS